MLSIMLTLSLCTVNVHGLRDQAKCSNVISWLKIMEFDFVFLQETYLHSSDFHNFKKMWNGPVFYSSAPSTHSSGVAIACSSKLPFSYSQLRSDNNGRVVSILCSTPNSSFRICNVYAPCDPKERVSFFNDIYTYSRGNEPLVVGGDFNCILHQKDRSGDSRNTSSFVGRKELTSFIKSYSLVDAWLKCDPSDSGHTWVHTGKSQSSRIDRFYVNENFNIVKASKVPFHLSDHDAVNIVIEIPNHNTKFRTYWKFNVSMCKDDVFVDDLTFHYRMWQTLKPGFDSIIDWWENIKGRVQELCTIHGVRRARERRRQLSNLQQTCLSGDKEEVSKILSDESRGAFIRSRERFLEEGEKPGGYFYKAERANAEAKCIKEIRNSQGDIVSGDEVTTVFHDFFTNLYTCDLNVDHDVQDVFLNSISDSISQEKSNLIDKPIELSEIKKALMSMAKNKSPGIDGLPVEFYLQFYDIICDDLLMVYNEVYSSELLSNTQRMAVITLLPKKGDPLDPANRRPISLLTVDYKVIAKILQLRISSVLPDVVNECQTCSVPGRSIHHNLCLLRDIVDCAKLRGNSCALISIDQHKAFDKVNWEFLFKVLKKFNFGNRFIMWVKILYTDIKSRILVNGQLSDEVNVRRGVRQGCPLSPVLYVLFIEPLARFIMSRKDIRGFHIPGGRGRCVKLLQYADDATCVATSQTDIVNLFKSFALFEKASGASLNLKKTYGLKLGDFVGRKLMGDINWVEDKIYINGVCFGTDNCVRAFWKSLCEIAIKKVKLWESRGLTLLGKIGIVNTCIYPLFYYAARVYLPEPGFYKEIVKVVFRFIWQKKTELVSRDTFTLSSAKGGLNLDRLSVKMQALFIRDMIPHLLGQNNMSYNSMFLRYFMAQKLRNIYPIVWSNLVPHSEIMSASYENACSLILTLYNSDPQFANAGTRTRDIIRLLMSKDYVPRAMEANPLRDWPVIWEMTHHSLLCNALKSFNWRTVHGALYTREKLSHWSVSDGKCPCCHKLESIDHVFWDCSSIYNILCWANEVTKRLLGPDVSLSQNLFLYGFPTPQKSQPLWARVWFIYVVTRKAIWNRRCTFIFENKLVSEDALILKVKEEIRLRILVDFKRWSQEKFMKSWVQGSTLCLVLGKDVTISLP